MTPLADQPAFPRPGYNADDTPVAPGLTVRQHFAATAMQGLLSDMTAMRDATKEAQDRKKEESSLDLLAVIAVHAADALIAALSKPQQP